MLVASYSRVSSQRQEQEQTIETQLMAIKDFSKANNHTIVKVYKDEGWSGTILARPSLDELRIDSKNKIWEAVIIYDPDRLARKYSYQSLVIDELEEAGIKVLFVTTPPAKSDEDKLLYGVKGIFAEYERARIADRFRLGKLRKAREGHILTTEAPYGYVYILKQGLKQGYLQINNAEALVVKRMFTWIGEEGLTIRTVVRKLQELNIKPRRSKKGVWNTSTIGTLLRNETYIGKAHYYRSYAVVPDNPLKQEKYKKVKKTSRRIRPENEWIEIPAPKIISEELFEKTRRQLKENFELCKRNRKNEYLLSGRIYCTCGRKRAGEGPQKGKHLYYRCTDRVFTFPLRSNCIEKGINARIADKLVWDRLSSLISSPKLIRSQAEKWFNNRNDSHTQVNKTIEEINLELDKLKKEEKRYLKTYGAGLITINQLQEVVLDVKSKREGLDGQYRALQEQDNKINVTMPTSSQIDAFVEKVKEYLPDLRFETRQIIVRKLIDKVVASQEEMSVNGYLPLELEENYVKFKTSNRDGLNTTRHFPFKFQIKIPSPRYSREITERDKSGRIIGFIVP